VPYDLLKGTYCCYVFLLLRLLLRRYIDRMVTRSFRRVDLIAAPLPAASPEFGACPPLGVQQGRGFGGGGGTGPGGGGGGFGGGAVKAGAKAKR
jgi:hypothetical protein